MIFSTSYFSRTGIILLFSVLFVIAGCAGHAPSDGGGQRGDGSGLSEKLVFKSLKATPASPQRAMDGAVRWTATVSGGQGDVLFTFLVERNGVDIVEQTGLLSWIEMTPKRSGKYRVKVIAADASGDRVESHWSDEYIVSPALSKNDLLAVLPVDNLSGVKAPLGQIRDSFARALAREGVPLLEEAKLQDFLRKYRVRYTGGVGSRNGKALQEEVGTRGVFVLSLESYQEADPPKVSLIARLVLSKERPEIVWMDSVGLSGDESPGFLGLGLIAEDDELIENAVDALVSSFSDFLTRLGDERLLFEEYPLSGEGGASFEARAVGQIKPKSYYRSPAFDSTKRISVAVLPFSNKYARKNAGLVIPLHLMKYLLNYENLEVIEPGLIRETLLNFRIVMEAGPSLAVSEILASERSLGADLVVAGNVFDYQGLRGVPKVNFSVQAVEAQSSEVVWWSRSYAAGDDGVFFFNVGKKFTAHELTSRMANAVVSLLVEEGRE